MTRRVEGKVCLVFGAGSDGPGWGNGKACAVTYARQGGRVACIDRVTAAAEETAGLIRAEGGEALAITADVTSDADVARATAEAIQRWGTVDVLHNNVGVTAMGGPIELDEATFTRMMDVNVTSMFRTAKHCLPPMLAQGRGAIVNVSSIAGIRYLGYPFISYYASKGAVNQFTVGLALQYAAQGVRVNAVLPGLIDTPLIYRQISGQYESPAAMVAARDAMCPTGKMGTAWDVANAALFLASDEAGYVNGVCLPVDGGHHMKIG